MTERLQPFPHQKLTSALREEEAFMQAHGGYGCRFLFKLIEAVSCLCR